MSFPKTWYHGDQPISSPQIMSKLRQCEEVFVGCDSKHFRDYVIYAYAICFRDVYGINYFWAREKRRNGPSDLYSRIWGEVERSVEVGNWIRENVSAEIMIEVHADINSNPKYASNLYNQAASGYITGCGYHYRCKPDAWAATSVADWYTR